MSGVNNIKYSKNFVDNYINEGQSIPECELYIDRYFLEDHFEFVNTMNHCGGDLDNFIGMWDE